MMRSLTIAVAAALLALPAASATACPAHDHTASTEATSVDLAAAAKKALSPTVKQDNADEAKPAPSK